MTTTNKTFSVRNGIDVANTIIVSNSSGTINVSNITVANVITLNATNILTSAGLDVVGQANAAYAQANTANTTANALVALAAAAYALAQSAYLQANAAPTDIYANSGLIFANTSNLTFNNTVSVNALVVANGTNSTNVSFVANTSALSNGGVYVAGTLVANNPNINFVAANTSNLSITGTSNTSPGNVTIIFDTLISGGGGGGSSVIYDNSFVVGSANQTTFTLTQNAASESYIIVARNGIVQEPLADYQLAGNVNLTLSANCNLGDVVDVRIFAVTNITLNTASTINVNGGIYFTSGAGTQYDNPAPMGVMFATSQRFLISMGTPIF